MSETLRVRHLASGDLWAGAEVQTKTLLAQLVRDRALALEVVLFNDGRLATETRALGIPTVVFDERSLGPRALYQALANHFRSQPVDLLHTHKYKENVLGAFAARRTGAPRVVRTMHGWPEPFVGLRATKMRLYQRLDRWVNRHWVDRVIAVSEQIRVGLQELGPERAVCIHNGIDLAEFDRRDGTAISPVANAAFVIGTVGRLTAVKGYEFLLRALPALCAAVPGRTVCLRLVGDGPLHTPLRELAQRLGVSDRVVFCGHQDDSLEQLRQMHLVVFPSLSEGIPMALLEALALSRPVVASRVGGIPEVIRDGLEGLLVAPQDPAGLARACARLANDAALAQRLGRAGREIVHKRFSAQRNADLTVRLYRDLACSVAVV